MPALCIATRCIRTAQHPGVQTRGHGQYLADVWTSLQVPTPIFSGLASVIQAMWGHLLPLLMHPA